MNNRIILSVILDGQPSNIMLEENILAICKDIRSKGLRIRRDVMRREKVAYQRVRNAHHNR